MMLWSTKIINNIQSENNMNFKNKFHFEIQSLKLIHINLINLIYQIYPTSWPNLNKIMP